MLTERSAEAACAKPNVLLMVDNSCSMGFNGSRNWNAATAAIKTITNNYRTKLNWGLGRFSSSASIAYGIDRCIRDGTRCVANLQSALNRIRPSGGTNLVAGITVSQQHLQAVKNADSVKTRKQSLVFITDGQAGCAQTQVASLARIGVKTYVIGFGSGVSTSCLNSMAQSGGTALSGSRKYYQANSKSEMDRAMKAIANAATTEVCNNADDDCDGQVDEGLSRVCSSACGQGKQVCSRGKWGTCTGKVATPEKCDGIDNDCNGRVDEKWTLKGRICTVGSGGCKSTGIWRCNASGSGLECPAKPVKGKPETCDGQDNDCDGKVDQNLKRACRNACGTGTETCSAGRWTGCTAPKPTSELCDGKDNDCDGKVDENWPTKGRSCAAGSGACRRTGQWQCSSNKRGVVCNAKSGTPTKEKCNGKDDDCDGKVDEDFANKGKSCSSGTGACGKNGTYVCKPDGSGTQCSASGGTPKPEVCDGKDNDCNGKIDDRLTRACKTSCGSGVETCSTGKWINCSARKPVPEKCNGRDDDCDGTVDESLTQACSTACGKGTATCKNGSWENCTARKPVPEKCNGLDDDCNGKTDEIPPQKCQGACGSGQAVCQDGSWSGCSGRKPTPEICDGKDNDCNGKIDDGVKRKCKTACGGGEEVCSNGRWGACSAPSAQPEICNGRDDNCDGKADNNAVCPKHTKCVEGQCRPPCSAGECRGRLRCVNGTCVGDACAGIKCGTGEKCLGGKCIKPCDLIKCPTGTVCSQGQCVKEDCYIKGCAKSERCVNGTCEKDPCAIKQCGAGQFCREGTCVATCAKVKCASNEKCVDGRCQADPKKSGPCESVTCPTGQYCENGKCVGDPCNGVFCGKGRECVSGRCTHDPCANIECPDGSTCRQGQCITPPGKENPGTLPDGGPAPGTDGSGPGTPGSEKGGPGPKPGEEGYDPGNGKEQGTGPGTKTVDGGVGGQFGDFGSSRRYNTGGCACSTQSGDPSLPLSIMLLFVVVLFARRRQSQG